MYLLCRCALLECFACLTPERETLSEGRWPAPSAEDEQPFLVSLLQVGRKNVALLLLEPLVPLPVVQPQRSSSYADRWSLHLQLTREDLYAFPLQFAATRLQESLAQSK